MAMAMAVAMATLALPAFAQDPQATPPAEAAAQDPAAAPADAPASTDAAVAPAEGDVAVTGEPPADTRALDETVQAEDARSEVERIAKDVLANPVIEDYRVEIVQ